MRPTNTFQSNLSDVRRFFQRKEMGRKKLVAVSNDLTSRTIYLGLTLQNLCISIYS